MFGFNSMVQLATYLMPQSTSFCGASLKKIVMPTNQTGFIHDAIAEIRLHTLEKIQDNLSSRMRYREANRGSPMNEIIKTKQLYSGTTNKKFDNISNHFCFIEFLDLNFYLTHPIVFLP